MPITGQPSQRTGIGQKLLSASIESRPFAKVGDVDKRTARTRRLDTSGIVLAKALDHAQTEANRRLRTAERFQAAIPVAGPHVHWADLQMVATRVLQNLVGL